MHELAVTKSILKLALDQAAEHHGRQVVTIHLLIGEMRNLEEDWIQRYFDYISKGSLAEGAVIKVTKSPINFLCKDCGEQFTANLKEGKKVLCPRCSSFEYDLTTGRELTVEKMEIR